jgi:hypothetical protein
MKTRMTQFIYPSFEAFLEGEEVALAKERELS